MFKPKQKEIDDLNKRRVELARELRDTKQENKELKLIRIEAERKRTKAEKRCNELEALFDKIDYYSSANAYGKPEARLNKIKELVQSCIVKH